MAFVVEDVLDDVENCAAVESMMYQNCWRRRVGCFSYGLLYCPWRTSEVGPLVSEFGFQKSGKIEMCVIISVLENILESLSLPDKYFNVEENFNVFDRHIQLTFSAVQ